MCYGLVGFWMTIVAVVQIMSAFKLIDESGVLTCFCRVASPTVSALSVDTLHPLIIWIFLLHPPSIGRPPVNFMAGVCD